MPEANAKRVARRARYRALGVCVVSAKHGPAVAYGLCEACAETHRAKQRRAHARARERGICVNAPAHGTAPNGRLCARCFAVSALADLKRKGRWKPPCVFGASHGKAIDGTYCASCVARRAAAAERIAARNAVVPKPPPSPKPARRKETFGERIARGGNIDSSNLWERFWRQQ
jgi:hypothetical protein